MKATSKPRAFKVDVSEDAIKDLKSRLAANLSRDSLKGFRQEETTSHGKYGVSGKSLKELLTYWLNEYDWMKWQNVLNSYDQFQVEIQNITVHYYHIRSKEVKGASARTPLLLLHGWPGSVFEFYKIIPTLLPDFDLVIPSLPGFGWSTTPDKSYDGIQTSIDAFNCLMVDVLGYPHYIAQGGDLGALVARDLALKFPRNCVAIHRNMNFDSPNSAADIASSVRAITHALTLASVTTLPSSLTGASEADKKRIQRLPKFVLRETAYLLLHATKPHTIGTCLDSSPAALCAWIMEKFDSWTHTNDEHIFEVLSKDELLTNISIYWFTVSMTSAVRFYHESFRFCYNNEIFSFGHRAGKYCSVPMGITYFAGEPYNTSTYSAKFNGNVVHLTDLETSAPNVLGGHFAAFVSPEVLAKDIRKFVGKSINFDKLCREADSNKDYGKPMEPNILTTLAIAARPVGVPLVAGIGGVTALAYSVARLRRKLLQ